MNTGTWEQVREIAHKNAHLTRKDLDNAFEMVQNGMDPADAVDQLALDGLLARQVAEKMGISDDLIYELVTEWYWKYVTDMA